MKGHKLWDFIELLDTVSQKQTLRGLFLYQRFVKKVLLEKLVRSGEDKGVGKAL